ncbi:hypothetical protein [Hymenobacter sp. UYCo722]|uniref:hypothetical protein n=1 Tax=Hymenobacter sp. UYCo722 TaxID=3156335 RepID=UPI003390FE55
MFRTLFSCLLLLAFTTGASAQTTPAPATTRHATQQKTTHRTTSTPRRATVRKTSTREVGLRKDAANYTPAPATSKVQSVYAAPGQPVHIKDGVTADYDGNMPSRAKKKASTTLTPR